MDRRSKEIFERQNMPGLVAAQKTAHNCYSVGKIWSVFLVVTSVAVPVAINVVLSLFDIDILNGCLIFASFLCLIVSEFIRTRIKKWKFYGAGMQQYFDEFVFGLKNSCKKYIYRRNFDHCLLHILFQYICIYTFHHNRKRVLLYPMGALLLLEGRLLKCNQVLRNPVSVHMPHIPPALPTSYCLVVDINNILSSLVFSLVPVTPPSCHIVTP